MKLKSRTTTAHPKTNLLSTFWIFPDTQVPSGNPRSTAESRPHRNTSLSEMWFVKGEHKQTLSSECLSLRDRKNNSHAAWGQILWVYTKSPDVLDGPTWSQELWSVFKRKPDLRAPRAPASAPAQAGYPTAPVDKEASLGCNSCLHTQKSQDKAFFCPLARTPFVLPDKRKYIASIRQREL